ncbi:MAG TPA: hypothetical protein VFL83_04310 [Anaeromyxobacter sp.]|nr:hypothetical protein [Anaeromyxobacter sp.]
MNRVLVALPLVAVLVAAIWPASPAQGAAPDVCEQMTAARLLEDPGLASAWADALRSGDADEIERVKALFAHIRSAHGCGGEIALPEAAPAPRLPPGHPPIAPGERPAGAVRFEEPGVVTI